MKKLKNQNILRLIERLNNPLYKMWNSFTYFFRRKTAQVKRLIKYVPIIWKGYDFDHRYATELFSARLEDIATHMEGDRAMSISANHTASRIRTAVKLMTKVYDEDYACEYQNKLELIYGKELMDYVLTASGEDGEYSMLRQSYELTETPERIIEIDAISSKLFKESRIKQEKAHRILWKFIEHNIRTWWD